MIKQHQFIVYLALVLILTFAHATPTGQMGGLERNKTEVSSTEWPLVGDKITVTDRHQPRIDNSLTIEDGNDEDTIDDMDDASGPNVTVKTMAGDTTERTPDSPPGLSVKQQASQLLIYKVGTGLHVYGTAIVILMGILSNLLSLAVFLQPSGRAASPCVYLAALGVADTGALLIVLVEYVAIQRPLTTLECRLSSYLWLAFSFTSALVLVMVSIERMVVTRLPLKAMTWCTPSRARIVCVLCFLASFGYHGPVLCWLECIGKLVTGWTLAFSDWPMFI